MAWVYGPDDEAEGAAWICGPDGEAEGAVWIHGWQGRRGDVCSCIAWRRRRREPEFGVSGGGGRVKMASTATLLISTGLASIKPRYHVTTPAPTAPPLLLLGCTKAVAKRSTTEVEGGTDGDCGGGRGPQSLPPPPDPH